MEVDAEKSYDEEEIYDKIISTSGEKLKNNGMIEDVDENTNKIKLKNPKNFELGENVQEVPAKEENKYIIGRKSFEDGEYFVIVRNSGKSLGRVEGSSELTETDPTIPIENLSKKNSCIGYLLKGKNTGFFNGSERLLKKFAEQNYGKYANVNQKFMTVEKFLEELKQISTPYSIEIELSNFAEPFVYVDYEKKHIIVDDSNHKLDEFLKTFNILLLKSLTLEDKDISYNKESLRIKFSVGKLSYSDGNSNLKIDPQFIRKGPKFEDFYNNIKEYTHIRLKVSERDKIEYLLVKRKIIKNLLSDENFIKEIKNIGIISEDSKWIKYSVDLDKIKETIKQNLPQGATLDGKPLNLDTKSFLFYNKNEIRENHIKEGCIFKIKQNDGQHVNLLLLNKYEFKEFKYKLGDEIKKLDQADPDKLAIEARSSYLYPFIVVDLNGTHIKYSKIITEVEAQETPFLIPAPIFLSDTKNSLENALTSYKKAIERRSMLATILYKIYEDYNKNPEIQKKVKRRGTYMEKILYAFINLVKGEAKRLGGPNQPDALLEDEDKKLLYIFDTKNLKRTKLINNIKDRTKKYLYTFEKYFDNMRVYNNGKDLNSYDKVHFIYVVDPLNENDKQQAEDIIRETLSNKYKDKMNKIEVSVWSFSDIYKKLYPQDLK